MPKFNNGDKVFVIESSIFIKEVYVINYSYGMYIVKYPDSKSGYKVRESRLYKTKDEAMKIVNNYKNGGGK